MVPRDDRSSQRALFQYTRDGDGVLPFFFSGACNVRNASNNRPDSGPAQGLRGTVKSLVNSVERQVSVFCSARENRRVITVQKSIVRLMASTRCGGRSQNMLPNIPDGCRMYIMLYGAGQIEKRKDPPRYVFV